MYCSAQCSSFDSKYICVLNTYSYILLENRVACSSIYALAYIKVIILVSCHFAYYACQPAVQSIQLL